MRVVPLAPKCGVEVEDVYLAEAEGDTLTAIKHAIYTHGVALFRGQADFTPEAHIAFAQRWGGIDINNYFPLTDEHPEIAVVRKRADQVTNIGGGWHTDHSYDQVPAMGSILVARTLPPSSRPRSRGWRRSIPPTISMTRAGSTPKPTWAAICAVRRSRPARRTRS